MNQTKSCLLFLLMLVQIKGFALTTDSAQPITLQADSAEFDRVNGTTTYSGSVVMQQGSMKIEAGKIVIYGKLEKAGKVVATGSPAKFQQLPKEDAGFVKATANKLEYFVEEKALFLVDKATLKQDGSRLSGDRIEYDVRQAIVKASGKDSDTNRVKVVIPVQMIDTPSQ